MSNNESTKGFAGLSSMVSDGTVPAAATSAPEKYKNDLPREELEHGRAMVELTKVPTNTTISRTEASLWEKWRATADTGPDRFATARKPFFGGYFELDSPVGKYKCAQFTLYGTIRN